MGTTVAPRKLTKDEVTVALAIEPEEVSHRGLEWEVENAFPGDPSGPPEDLAKDVEMRADICRRVRRGDDWAFGCAVVTVEWQGFRASNTLGHCSYADEEDFRRDGYYADMVDETLEELNGEVAAALAKLMPLVEVTEPRLPFMEFVNRATAGIPGAEVGQDNDGQLVLYTGYREMSDNGEFAVRMEE